MFAGYLKMSKVAVLFTVVVMGVSSLYSAPLHVTSTPVTTAKTNNLYLYNLNADGGDGGPYTWEVKSPTTLPSWLTLIPDTNASTVAGGNGVGAGLNQLHNPIGVALDHAGNVYVADKNNSRIVKWAPGATTGVVVAGGNGAGAGLNQLNYPDGISIDGSGNMYIADTNNHRVMKWIPGHAEGVVVAGGNDSNATHHDALNQLYFPAAVSFDSDGNLTIADTRNHRVVKWAADANITTDSGVVVAGGSQGSADDQLDVPTGVSLDSNDNVYVSDRMNHRVMKWVPGATTGVVVAGGNGAGAELNQLDQPDGIITVNIGGDLYIYISDAHNHRIVRWKDGAYVDGGVLVAGGNGSGTNANQLNTPFGLTLDSNRNVYVADRFNNRIQKFHNRLTGTPSDSDVGIHDVNLTVSDNVPTQIEHNFQITVEKSNANPALIMYLLN